MRVPEKSQHMGSGQGGTGRAGYVGMFQQGHDVMSSQAVQTPTGYASAAASRRQRRRTWPCSIGETSVSSSGEMSCSPASGGDCRGREERGEEEEEEAWAVSWRRPRRVPSYRPLHGHVEGNADAVADRGHAAALRQRERRR